MAATDSAAQGSGRTEHGPYVAHRRHRQQEREDAAIAAQHEVILCLPPGKFWHDRAQEGAPDVACCVQVVVC